MANRFDPAKDALNRKKHNLPLSLGSRIFEDDSHLVLPTFRPEDGEERFKVVGVVEQSMFTAVFVWRDAEPRFISVRRSNKREEKAYRDPG
ncbi:BrnT family toxin [Aquibaculum arenosum]|uniref:BrnT family toxin n=1 Tax=Aquibaculum arenosum TaxID=3032591 RepID=A0ABT5YPE4_9PROT|nr:BrnT family toxin [Fodinicurvata sp. CAU 1616]MDF2096749.1 BrnT family toxin [Fodinicurvata sp. CAU 1616]